MLVISRRIGESFFIGDDMEVTVVDISGGKVILGVQAPKKVPIERLPAIEKKGTEKSVNQRGYSHRQKEKNAE